MKITCPNGHVYDSVIYGAECPFCPRGLSSEMSGVLIEKTAVSSKKYRFSDYYKRYRVCKKCREYVPSSNVCPGCGSGEMEIIIGDKYLCSNPRKCEKCSYESWKLDFCPKCGSRMAYVYPYIIGDFCSAVDFYPDVEDCVE